MLITILKIIGLIPYYEIKGFAGSYDLFYVYSKSEIVNHVEINKLLSQIIKIERIQR